MHKTKIVAILAAIGIGLTCVTTAQAGFVNEVVPAQKPLPPTAPPTPAASVAPAAPGAATPGPDIDVKRLTDVLPASSGRKVTQIGMRPSDVPVPRGRGRDIALADMLPVIVPRDFRLDIGSVDRRQLVAWSGGLPWDSVLTNAIMPLDGVEATIDWNQRVVSLRRVSPASAMAANNISNGVPGERGIPQAVAMRWDVRVSDVTLRQTLMRWAKDAGWQVSWEIPYDYPVQLDATFSGSFEDVVTQFMATLKNSDYPALGCLYEANHVVRVLHYGDKQECEK